MRLRRLGGAAQRPAVAGRGRCDPRPLPAAPERSTPSASRPRRRRTPAAIGADGRCWAARPAGAAAGQPARAGRRRPGRAGRGADLHLGHGRCAQGRDADPRQPDVHLGALLVLARGSRPPTGSMPCCRSATSSASPRCCSARSTRAAGSTSWRASCPRRRRARSQRTASRCSRACRRCTPACSRSPRRAAGRSTAPTLRYTSAGGAPLDLALKQQIEAMWRLPLHNGYGLTEASPTVATTRDRAPAADHSCGPPLPDVEVRIAAATATVPAARSARSRCAAAS